VSASLKEINAHISGLRSKISSSDHDLSNVEIGCKTLCMRLNVALNVGALAGDDVAAVRI
jgi:hypothetical protein